MRFTSYVIAACMMAAPVLVLAQDQPTEEEKEKEEEEEKKQEEEAEDKAKMEGKVTKEAAKQQVKGHVLPMVVGTESARMCAAALNEIAMMDMSERTSARMTADLANAAVTIAHERAKQLSSMTWLSQDAAQGAKDATKELARARTTVTQIQRQVGASQGMLESKDAETLRTHAKQLNAALDEANGAIKKVADAYKVSTDLKMKKVSSVAP